MAACHEANNSIKPPFPRRDLKCSSRLQSKGTQTRDECEVKIRVLVVVGNIQKRALSAETRGISVTFSSERQSRPSLPWRRGTLRPFLQESSLLSLLPACSPSVS